MHLENEGKMAYASVYKNFIYPIYHNIKRDRVVDRTKALEEQQWYSTNELLILQKAKLNKLLQHAFTNVPFYRKIAQRNSTNKESIAEYHNFCRLPYLSKKDIKENINDLVAQNINSSKLIPNSTSGSTGEALYFFTDSRSQSFRKACANRNIKWAGGNHGDKMITLWGAPMDLSKSATLRGRLHAKITRNLILSSYDLYAAKMDEYINLINEFKPKLMISYPGPLEVFARHVSRTNATLSSIESIITSAEQLFPHQRELFAEVFDAKIYNRYGCREFGTIAQECCYNAGLHINSDRVFVEVLDNNGEPTKEGQLGELFITDLDNFGMPMIRYQIGDMGVWSKNRCDCKRGLTLLSSIEGRSLDVVTTPSNHKIGGTYWTILFRSKPGIHQFQIVQNNISGITVYYVPSEQFKLEILDFFKNQIQDKCGTNFDVIFQRTDKIGKIRSGKNKIIISNVCK